MYNFFEEFLDKNCDLHDKLSEEYEIISEGGNSVVYKVSENRVLKVFSLKNHAFSRNYFNFYSEVEISLKSFSTLNIKLNDYLKNSKNYNLSIEEFLINNVFDNSFKWLKFCKNNKSKYIPKIYSLYIDIESCSYIIEMELLDNINTYKEKYGLDEINFKIEIIKKIIKNIKKVKEENFNTDLHFLKNMKEKVFLTENEKYIKNILKFIHKISKEDDMYKLFEENSDFSDNNILFRNKTLVLSDPLY